MTAQAPVSGARAVLLTGVYGTGKSSVAEEIAELLEANGEPFAAVDLDWLSWSNVAGAGHDDHTILARNLAAMARNYLEVGVLRFVLAGWVTDAAELDAVRIAIVVPLTVVRLTAPLSVIETRLGESPTSGRANDLAVAREWLAAGADPPGLDDVTIENVGPIRETARRVLEFLGW